MANYYQFTKKHFEFEMKGILIRNKLGFMEDITDAWKEENPETWERIYKISTKNKSVDIIVFSSVDIRTGKVRDNGADRVRLVLRWKTKNGFVFKRIHHHNRLNTLFINMEKTLKNAVKDVFNLNYREFTKSNGSEG